MERLWYGLTKLRPLFFVLRASLSRGIGTDVAEVAEFLKSKFFYCIFFLKFLSLQKISASETGPRATKFLKSTSCGTLY